MTYKYQPGLDKGTPDWMHGHGIPAAQADATYVRKTTPADDAEKHFDRARDNTHGRYGIEKVDKDAKAHVKHDPLNPFYYNYDNINQKEDEQNTKNEENVAKKAVEMRKKFPKDERNSP